jgi:SPX domain protein involved in polyphosphate accumulation
MANRDYDEAKRMLKQGSVSGKFSESDEADFVVFLENELEKVTQ